jgi:protein-tyrosine-phosphatase
MASEQNRRSFLQITCTAAAGFFFASTSGTAAKPCAMTRVLFVCPLGVVQSVIAREELRRIAKARGLRVQALSRGIDPPKIHPEADISPGLAAHLRERNIDAFADPLRRYSRTEPTHADITIAFNEAALAPGLEQARAWKSPSWNDQYPEANEALAKNIEALVSELAARQC